MKTGAGEYILGVTRPNGECSQNLVSNTGSLFSGGTVQYVAMLYMYMYVVCLGHAGGSLKAICITCIQSFWYSLDKMSTCVHFHQ